MRILITNDDGVFAPGIAALAKGLASVFGSSCELLVVAPLSDHSGTGAAVGPVYERESIPYEAVEIPGLADIPVYGIDGPPALAVILACIEGFGRRPDLVVSGINHGVNAGRSTLHSGTVGAVLTSAQFGIRGLAVSIAWGPEPVPWETPVRLASEMVTVLAGQAPGTVLNLNVPAVAPAELRGLRYGRLGVSGLIRSVRPESTPYPVEGAPVDRTAGAIVLNLRGSGTEDGAAEWAESDSDTDTALVAQGWATLTPLVGVREDTSERGVTALGAALDAPRPSPEGDAGDVPAPGALC